jgi:type VI secretion system secreted protein VgrG
VNSSYLVTSVQHKAAGGDVRSWDSTRLDYENTFRAMPAATVYRPSPSTPRPRIFGTLPAVVTGPKGEEIHVDKHARVKIQFFWDRYGKRDETSSCWVRVATTWAGKGWGAIHIPRIGQEVVVGFLDGNPDQPMIVGSVFNGEQTPPEGLPGAMTQSGIRSSTHKGKGMNELIMDDTAGKERVSIHAQYDMITTVQHDQTNTINNHRTTSITVNDTEKVGANQTVDIAAKQSVSVGADQKIGVSGKLDYTVGGNLTITTGSAAKFSSTGAMTVEADGAQKVITKADQTLSAAGATSIKSGASMKISATGELAITAASLKITVAGNTVEIGPAGVKITSPALVDIKGSVVKVNS